MDRCTFGEFVLLTRVPHPLLLWRCRFFLAIPAPRRMFTASNETTDGWPGPLGRPCSGTNSRRKVSRNPV